MVRIYIGYHAGSTDVLAQQIRQRLGERFGASVVLDPPEDLRPGQDFQEYSQSAIQRSNVIILLIDEAWLAAIAQGRVFLIETMSYILRSGVPILPIPVGPKPRFSDSLPPPFQQVRYVQSVSFSNLRGEEHELRALERAIGNHLERPRMGEARMAAPSGAPPPRPVPPQAPSARPAAASPNRATALSLSELGQRRSSASVTTQTEKETQTATDLLIRERKRLPRVRIDYDLRAAKAPAESPASASPSEDHFIYEDNVPEPLGRPAASAPEPRILYRKRQRFSVGRILTIAGVISVIGIALALGYQIAVWTGTALKLIPAAVPTPPPGTDGLPISDLVDVSAFAPDGAQAGEDVLVQVYLHQAEQASQVEALAKEADPDATRRGVTTLQSLIERGKRIDVILECAGATIDEPAQYLIWRGDPRACQFVVTLPKDASPRNLQIRVRLHVDSTPVGSLRFALRILSPQEAAAKADIRGDWARRYRRAFLSYASPDRAEVLKRAQALRALHIDFFQDLLSLEPGERWEKRLYEEMDRCDLFLLFWSTKAAESNWVIREAEYALKRRLESGADLPDITPIILEGPPVPAAPTSLKDIQFNDYLRYVISAVEAEKRVQ